VKTTASNSTPFISAQRAYEHRQKEAKTLLKEIALLIHAHNVPEHANWGHVGSIGHVVEELIEIKRFLKTN
jgi:hypothetical protein